MDRNSITGIVLIMGMLLGYQYFFAPKEEASVAPKAVASKTIAPAKKDTAVIAVLDSTVQKELSGYHWMDVSFNYQWNDKFRMHLMIKNALNQKIVELYGYNGVPVLFSGGVNLVIE